MALTEIGADLRYGLLEVRSEVFAVNEEGLIAEEMLKLLGLRVQVADGIISTILSSILAWEAEAISACSLQRESVVNKVDVAGGPLLVVLDEAVVEVAARHVVGRVLIVAYNIKMSISAYP